MSVRDDLGGIQCLLEVLKELLSVAIELRSGARENLGSTNTLVLDGAQASCEDSLTDEGDGHTKVESVDGGPLASTFLTSRVENLLNEWLSVVVVEAKDITSDLDQERVQDALVPFLEDIGHLRIAHAQTSLHDIVRLWWWSEKLDIGRR